MMTLEEYVKEVKGLVKQYEDGAITEAEMVNGVYHYSVKAVHTEWYAESQKLAS